MTFPGAASSPHRWADALAGLVRAGRYRSLEVRKVNGEALNSDAAQALGPALREAGFSDGYRGFVVRA